MVVQIFWGRRDIMCSLQPMAPNLLHMALSFLLMVLSFLLMVHLLLRNHLQLMVVLALVLGRLTPEPICPLATVFLLAMDCRIMHTNLTWVVSHNILEHTRNLEPTRNLERNLEPTRNPE